MYLMFRSDAIMAVYADVSVLIAEKKPRSGGGTDNQLVALLRSQILTLTQENDHLKEKLQVGTVS